MQNTGVEKSDVDNHLIEIGKRLMIEKVRLGLKSLEVSLMLDCHPNTYRNYELGKRDMPVSFLYILSKSRFDFDEVYILTGKRLQGLVEVEGDGEQRVASYIDGGISTDYIAPVKKPTKPRLFDLEKMRVKESGDSNALILRCAYLEDALLLAGAKPYEDYSYLEVMKLALD